MNWINKNDRRPKDGHDIIYISEADDCVYNGYYNEATDKVTIFSDSAEEYSFIYWMPIVLTLKDLKSKYPLIY